MTMAMEGVNFYSLIQNTFLFFILIFGQVSLSVCDARESQIPNIKVKIQNKLEQVVVSGLDITRILHNLSTKLKQKSYNGKKRIVFNCAQANKKTWEQPLLLASLSSPTGLISLSKEKYQGLLHIVTSEDGRNCDVVNETSLEFYISSLLSKEMNATWPIEALKAQAVAARTYALYKINKTKSYQVENLYDLESSERHQVSGAFFDATKNTVAASLETEGEVLQAKSTGEMTPVFFHAKCGGKTLRPEQVWENKVTGYASITCPFCSTDGKDKWEKNISVNKLKKFFKWYEARQKINLPKFNKKKIHIVPDSFSQHELRFYFDDEVVVVGKNMLRRYFGRVIFPSHQFTFNMDEKNKIAITGKGRGHGVGMCQLGALDLAQKGWSYQKILAYYFPGHKLQKIY